VRLRRQIGSVGRRVANIFYQFLQRFISRPIFNSRQTPDDSQPERTYSTYQRDFRRYPIELNVSVAFGDEIAGSDDDKGDLQDISGGGALFVPCHPEQYYTGQQIEVTIFLASTNDVQACIRTEATVVRIETIMDPKAGETACVAVRFEQTFDFERMDSGHGGMNA